MHIGSTFLLNVTSLVPLRAWTPRHPLTGPTGNQGANLPTKLNHFHIFVNHQVKVFGQNVNRFWWSWWNNMVKIEDSDKQRWLSTVALPPQHIDANTTPPHSPRRHQSHSNYRPVNTMCYNRTQCSDTIGYHPLICVSLYHIPPNVCLLVAHRVTIIFLQILHCPILLLEYMDLKPILFQLNISLVIKIVRSNLSNIY